ncbi:MAG: type I restriction enzyme HsdR N-terminal domain-containing protein, partial [Flavobacteriaceae bacterium]|nr:type I restriction enzyme HsdR N-terminal domain-containing protein [Flavobacteriaceae bacterium]
MSYDYSFFAQTLGFSPKENSTDIFAKKYADGYVIEVDFAKDAINYGEKIQFDSKTTQNFSQPENFVVLECVNRLLEKGYKPENIILEKTWKLGHQEKGRLDILVTKDDGTAYLMIECKTYGEEFDKELKNLHKNGGQLFSYFQQDKNAEILMLYASELRNNKIEKTNVVIQIKEEYRQTGNLKQLFETWNNQTLSSDFWNFIPYNLSEVESFTKNNLRELNETEGQSLFNKFATILRKHSVSDKPNAFNKI